MWFEQLFGQPEAGWDETRAMFALDGTGVIAPNGRWFGVGRFSTPNLGELRARAQQVGRRGRLRLTHQAIGDALELHALPQNRGALFQVASQFNCLEFPGPSSRPEHGITGYANDPTQGPACSLAAAAATLYRNYFVPVGGGSGQRADRQLDNLADVAAALGPAHAYFTVHNGYTHSDAGRLRALREVLDGRDRDALVDAVRIGLQTGVEVTFARRYIEPTTPTSVSQAFCSAISCGYVHNVPVDDWAPLARLVLDAAYEATLWAAIVDAVEGEGSGRVWLTFIGGGVFANRSGWIASAIQRALHRVHGFDLDVRVGHYLRINPAFEDVGVE